MAKIEVTRQVDQKETIDIEFPYYYRHDLDLDHVDCVIYGMIEEGRHVCIRVSRDFHGQREEFELEIEKRKAHTLGCYMTEEHRGSEEEFAKARNGLLKATESI